MVENWTQGAGGWEHRKRASGVLCDRHMKLVMTENVYQTVVGPNTRTDVFVMDSVILFICPIIIGFVLQDESNFLPRLVYIHLFTRTLYFIWA